MILQLLDKVQKRVRETYNLSTLETIFQIMNLTNNAFDFAFFWAGLFAIIPGYPAYFFIISIKKSNFWELIQQATIVVCLAGIMGFLWGLPELMTLNFPDLYRIVIVIPYRWSEVSTIIRWLELALAMFVAVHLFEYEKKRWLRSWLGHFGAIFLGLLLGGWVGVFFISLPLLGAYYASLYNLAIIILPTSNPEDRKERWKRFAVLASYSWGIQSPMYVTNDNAWKKIDTRIPGDFTWDFSDIPIPFLGKFLLRPSLVWARSHQAVAVSGGTTFKRIDGPGVFFVGKLETPSQVFDLRMQLRTNEIDVVSKDGVSFKARVFTAFRMDNEDWTDEINNKVRPMNAILRGGRKLTHTTGSFPYSHLRVQAALGTTSTRAVDNNPIIYWDQWTINIVEDQARKAISQKNLDELWRPKEDRQFANALDIIANEIRENAELILRSSGILLVVARVVNFRFSHNNGHIDDISQQQLATWASEWERRRSDILSTAQAEAEHTEQEARAYAEAVMLNSIAEGLQKTKEMNPRLPPYVIAMLFLSTLQDHISTQSSTSEQDAEQEKKMTELHNTIKEWQDQFFPRSGREKKQ